MYDDKSFVTNGVSRGTKYIGSILISIAEGESTIQLSAPGHYTLLTGSVNGVGITVTAYESKSRYLVDCFPTREIQWTPVSVILHEKRRRNRKG